MDVRCENCHVEYELPDAKLKPGGVTVKCVECGHMFRIRKRAATNPGAAPAPRNPASSSEQVPQGPAAGRKPRRPPTKPPPGAPGSGPIAARARSASGANKTREWLIKLDDGEVMRCQELSTLQQWIVGGQVSRASSISRNGKTWKPLGSIPELQKYFDIAEQARARSESSRQPKAARSTPAASSTPMKMGLNTGQIQAQDAEIAAAKAQARRAAVEGLTAKKKSGPTPSPSDLNTTTSLKVVKKEEDPAAADTVTVAQAETPEPEDSGRRAIPRQPVSENATGAWAKAGNLRSVADEGPRGPVGGMARGVPTDDVAFARNKKVAAKYDGKDDNGYSVEPMDFAEDNLREVKGGGAGKWVVLVSLLLIAVAGGAIYVFVLKGDGGKQTKTAGKSQAATDAGASDGASAAASDAGTTVKATPVGVGVMELASRAILNQDAQTLASMSDRLGKVDGADKKPEVIARQAAVQAALAQLWEDRASTAKDAKDSKRFRKRARGKARAAAKLANAALKLDRTHVAAMVALADALRLEGRPSRQIERWLRKALKRNAGDADARYVRAMLQLRDNEKRQAHALLEQLAAGMAKTGDTRPQYRLALQALQAKDYDAAREAANKILGVDSTNSAATSLLAKVREATSVSTKDPMPPEVNDGNGKKTHSGGSASYEVLLKRANKKAESGSCDAAMPLFRRALELNATGVGALAGLGYCHLDKKQFASAHDKFRAALVISSHYQPALMGIAEAYEQQGLKPQAIAAYKRLIAAHPNLRARISRIIQKLGGKVDGGSTTKPPQPKKPDAKKPDAKKPDAKKPAPKPSKADDRTGG